MGGCQCHMGGMLVAAFNVVRLIEGSAASHDRKKGFKASIVHLVTKTAAKCFSAETLIPTRRGYLVCVWAFLRGSNLEWVWEVSMLAAIGFGGSVTEKGCQLNTH